jgi:hypothetical protein
MTQPLSIKGATTWGRKEFVVPIDDDNDVPDTFAPGVPRRRKTRNARSVFLWKPKLISS